MKKYKFIAPNPDKLTNIGFYKHHKKGNWYYQPPCDFCYIEINFKTKEVIIEVECCETMIDMVIDTLLQQNQIKEIIKE